MPRSHPPTVLTLVERALREEVKLEKHASVLVAVSGGIDSMVLLHALARLSAKLEFSLAAHGVDHGLRPEAGAELDLAEGLANQLGVSFSRTHLALSDGGNLQARAREARHAALERARTEIGADAIATAHHADDRAETVLIRLLRGTGPRGLAVLPARSGLRIRPLIRCRRADIAAHARRHGLSHADDPSNRNARFLRVRVRSEVLPLLESLSPRIVEHLTALADEITGYEVCDRRDGEASTLVGLVASQRRELARLSERPSTRTRVRLSGDREARINPDGRGILVEPAPPLSERHGRR